VFSLTVEGSHAYYVGRGELLVHNTGCGRGLGTAWRNLFPPKRPRPLPRPKEPTITLSDYLALESYRNGEKLWPPPNSPHRRQLDQLEALVPNGPSPDVSPSHGTSASPNAGSTITLSDYLALESYRNGEKLWPPPNSPYRRQLDQLEALAPSGHSPNASPSPSASPSAEKPKEKARRWARDVPFPGVREDGPGATPSTPSTSSTPSTPSTPSSRPPSGTPQPVVTEIEELDEGAAPPRSPTPEAPASTPSSTPPTGAPRKKEPALAVPWPRSRKPTRIPPANAGHGAPRRKEPALAVPWRR
jgi:hypothetical protein